MKKVLSILFFMMITIEVFSLSGALSGEKDLKIIKTKWFDIIYPERCEESALIISENGDRIFQEVTSQYGIEPNFKLPVVITPALDSYNAFYTPAPYNRIVLYDTSTQTLDVLSSSFSENLLSTFRHELTHAVTFNIKNKFWDGFSNIFGDVMVPGFVFVTSGMAEGAAVASESAGGEGRLNDEFSKHFVKQAKIENCFPSYYDVQGAADNLIPGIQYYFNGAFHQWLQQTYGMEKYYEFWHRVINLRNIGVNWSFWETYGISVRKSWEQFKNNYEVPDVLSKPIEYGEVQDFFEKGLQRTSPLNNEGSRYNCLTKSDKGIYYLEEKSGAVYFVSKKNLSNEKIKPEKLFTQKGLDNITVSKDGRFVVISYFSNSDETLKSKIKIYDSEKKIYFEVSERGLKNGAIIKNQNQYFLVSHKYESPNNLLIIKQLIFEKNELVLTENRFILKEPLNTFVSNFIDLGNGTFGYIEKSKNIFSICISDLEGNILKKYSLNQGIAIRQLSENDGIISFSWAQKGTLPRLGILNLENEIINLNNYDISGGVFNPLIINYDDSQRVTYIGNFYSQNKILTMEQSNKILRDWHSYKIESQNVEKQEKEVKEENLKRTWLKSEDYKWYKNFYKGLIIPFSIYTSVGVGNNLGLSSPASILPFGITYATSNPWSNGTDDLFICTTGWGYLTNSIGIEMMLYKGMGTELFSYSVDLKTEFDKNGWKKSSGSFSFLSGFNFGRFSSLMMKNDFSIIGGKEDRLENGLSYLDIIGFWNPKLFQSCMPIDGTVIFDIINDFSIGYSNIHKSGPGRFEKAGFSISAGLGYIFDSKLGSYLTVTTDLLGKIPKLIQIPQKQGLVYNLPVVANFSLCPTTSHYGYSGGKFRNAGYGVLDTKIETVLFGMDIQKAIPYVDFLFLQNFSISAGYASTISSYKGTKKGFQLPHLAEYFSGLVTGNSLYLSSIYLTGQLNFVANIGTFATSQATIGVYSQFVFKLHKMPGDSKNLKVNIGIKGIF